MKLTHKQSKWFLIALAAIGIAGFGLYSMKHRSSPPEPDKKLTTINDTNAKLTFNINQNFQAITPKALAVFSKGALYGYMVQNDKNAECLISQTKVDKPGKTTAGFLRDGTFGAIKKNHPDAHLDSSAIVKVGAASGVLIEVSYTDVAGPVKRAEIAALDESRVTFAFCQSLAADNAKYYADFTIFFSSLKILPQT